MGKARQPNRGPAAAESNRMALLRAAEAVFDEQGLEAPLNAIAKEAGVGQGSLYRHFPNRVDLALAVFEANVAGLEMLAASETTNLEEILAYLTDRSIDSAAFVDIISSASGDERLKVLVDRILVVLADNLAEAHRTGIVRGDMEPADILMAVGMVAGLLPRMPEDERRATADRAWQILLHGLAPDRPQQPAQHLNNSTHDKEEL